jgi:hypothetical protein
MSKWHQRWLEGWGRWRRGKRGILANIRSAWLFLLLPTNSC